MKTISFFILSLLLQSVCAQTEHWEIKADSIITNAKKQIGVTYKWGTSEPYVSFDCSGFASYVYRSFDVPHSRSSKDYATLGKAVSLKECRKGDCIVFSGTTPGSKEPGHVGIVISHDKNSLKFIHCSSSKKHFGVVVTDYYNSSYPKRFLSVRRLF